LRKNDYIRNNGSGHIEISKYTGSEPSSMNREIKGYTLQNVNEIKHNDFTIQVQKIIPSELFRVFIYKDSHYLMIIDRNPNMWKDIIGSYYYIKNNKCYRE